jgi:hypothetical protein
MKHAENTASTDNEARLLIGCLAMDVLLLRTFPSAGMCLSSRCLAMGLYVWYRFGLGTIRIRGNANSFTATFGNVCLLSKLQNTRSLTSLKSSELKQSLVQGDYSYYWSNQFNCLCLCNPRSRGTQHPRLYLKVVSAGQRHFNPEQCTTDIFHSDRVLQDRRLCGWNRGKTLYRISFT